MAPARSEAQREASRTNGARSRGPISPAGKRRSSLNATTHGLSARTVVLPDEDRDAFDCFAAALAEEVGPVGAIGQVLLERLTVTAWRLRRAARIEADVLSDGRREHDGSTASLGLAFMRATAQSESFAVLARHEAALERSMLTALRELDSSAARRDDTDSDEQGSNRQVTEATADSSTSCDHMVATHDAKV